MIDLRRKWNGDREIAEALRRMVPELRKKAINAGAQAAFNSAQDSADEHTVTGALARSVTMQKAGEGYIIGHDAEIAPYAPFVHWGTRAHEIVPVEKEFLRWPSGAVFRFAQRVDHPGYEGDAYMLKARDEALKAMGAIANV